MPVGENTSVSKINENKVKIEHTNKNQANNTDVIKQEYDQAKIQEGNKNFGNNSLIVNKSLKLNKWKLGNVQEESKNKSKQSKYEYPVKLQIGE